MAVVIYSLKTRFLADEANLLRVALFDRIKRSTLSRVNTLVFDDDPDPVHPDSPRSIYENEFQIPLYQIDPFPVQWGPSSFSSFDNIKIVEATIENDSTCQEIMSSYDWCLATDASVAGGEGGGGFVLIKANAAVADIDSYPVLWRSHSYGAEVESLLHAVVRAAHTISGGGSLLVLTDSLSAILMIKSLSPKSLPEARLIRALNELARHVSIVIRHVRGHAGIAANEAADALAAIGSSAAYVRPAEEVVSHKNVKRVLGDRAEISLAEKVKTLAEEGSSGCKWYLQCGAPRLAAWELPRRISVIYNQICTGSCPRLNSTATYGFGGRNDPSRCINCGDDAATSYGLIDHFLYACPRYGAQREKLLKAVIARRRSTGAKIPGRQEILGAEEIIEYISSTILQPEPQTSTSCAPTGASNYAENDENDHTDYPTNARKPAPCMF
jgi:ribonuclease HI